MRWEEVHRDVFNAEASAIQTKPPIQVHLRSKYEAFTGEVLRAAAESGWVGPGLTRAPGLQQTLLRTY